MKQALTFISGLAAVILACTTAAQEEPAQKTDQPGQSANPGAPGQRYAQGAQNQPSSGQTHEPGAFFQHNPELARRYFPQMAGNSSPAGEDQSRVERPPVIKEIEFPGGTPEYLVGFLRQALTGIAGGPHGRSEPGTAFPNVIISPSMENITIPKFELHNVTVADVFQALNSVSDGKGGGRWQLSGSGQPIWILNPPNQNSSNPFVSSFPAPQSIRVSGQEKNRRCQVYPIEKYLDENYKIEDITTAIETAWGMTGKDPEAALKFHKDTNLLFATGTNDELVLVSDVLKAMDENSMRKRDFERVSAGKSAPPVKEKK